jgi:tRNA (guanine37-N1)-methyltransferase
MGSMTIDIVTIFPDFFLGPFEHGMIRRARQSGVLDLQVHDLRKYTDDRHHTVDDRPFGGEEGMVLKPEPLFRAVSELQATGDRGKVILLSAQGRMFRQTQAAGLAQIGRLILLCGRYEGVDERVAEHLADEELSIGDYVLSGGELAAAVVVDAITRLLPGVLGNANSAVRESFASASHSDPEGGDQATSDATVGILDCPHYTRPAVFDFEGRRMEVPPTLLSGNHKLVGEWRRRRALEKTMKNRPELLAGAVLDRQQQDWLNELKDRQTESEKDKRHERI